MVVRSLFACVAIFAVLAAVVHAQSVKAHISKNPVGLEEEFELSFSYETKSASPVEFIPPNLGNFYVFSGPNESRNMSLVNTDLRVNGSYSYILTAKKEGTFEIPGAIMKIEGKTYRTNSVKVIVEKGTGAGKRGNQEAVQGGLENEIFIRAIVDKPVAYEGEQITVNYKLYFNPALQPENPNYVKLPTFEGFWAEELQMPGQVMLEPEYFNGRQYYAGVIKTAALFATRSGTLEIAPLTLTIPVTAPLTSGQNDPFNDPFFRMGQRLDYKISSPPVKVQITPVPRDPSLRHFSGGVGSFDIKTSVKKREYKKNEPIRFEILITGRGNIELVDAMVPEFDKSFEVLDPNIDKKINRTGTISGSKSIEYILIPRDGGKYTLPGIEFSWFDLETKTMKTIRTGDIPVTVSAEAFNEGVTAVSEEDIDIYTGGVTLAKDAPSYPEVWFLLLLFAAPVAGAAAFISYRKKEETRLNDPAYKRRMAAIKIASERLAKAEALLGKGDHDQFYTEVATALEGYLITRHKLQLSEFTSSKVEATLLEKGFSTDIALEVKRLLDDCELMRFAPVDGKREKMGEFHARASAIIRKFEGGE